MKLLFVCLMTVFGFTSGLKIIKYKRTFLYNNLYRSVYVIYIGEGMTGRKETLDGKLTDEYDFKHSNEVVKGIMSTIDNNSLQCVHYGCKLSKTKPVLILDSYDISGDFTPMSDEVIDFSDENQEINLYFNFELTGSKYVFGKLLYAVKEPLDYVLILMTYSVTDKRSKYLMTMTSLRKNPGKNEFKFREYDATDKMVTYLNANKDKSSLIFESPSLEDLKKYEYDSFSCVHVETIDDREDKISNSEVLRVVINDKDNLKGKRFYALGERKEFTEKGTVSYERRIYMEVKQETLKFVCDNEDFSILSARII